MKDKRTLDERIKELIALQALVDEQEVTPSASLRDDLGMDSLDLIEMVISIEEAFDLQYIPDEEAENLKTVRQVIEYVTGAVAQKNQSPARRMT